MMRMRVVPTLLTLVGLTASCTVDEASAPATIEVATTTTAPPSTTTTTTVPATTTSTTTTTTTPAPTTTQVPGPRAPVEQPAPVFAGRQSDLPWVSLGGWSGTAFVGPTDDAAPAWQQGDEIRATSVGQSVQRGPLGEDVTDCTGRTGPRAPIETDAPAPPGFGFATFAVTGGWALRPRPVLPVETPIPEYATAARELLSGRVPSSVAGRLEQIVIADLVGDGTETSIVVYESVEAPAADGSGFSLLFTVDVATGAATEIDSDIVASPPPPPQPDEGEIPGGATTTTIPPPPPLERFRVLDVVDLNGDRVLELIVHSWTAGRFAAEIHELRDEGFEAVAGAACNR